MNISLLLARRFARAMRSEQTISQLITLCFGAITFGAFTLALAAAIMDGFVSATNSAFQNIHCDLTIQSPTGKSLAFSKIADVLNREYVSSVAHYTPIIENYAIVQSNTHANFLVTLAGIDYARDAQARALTKTICTKNFSPETFTQAGTGTGAGAGTSMCPVLMGVILAQTLGVHEGDTVTLAWAPGLGQGDLANCVFHKTRIKIMGLFKTGIDEIDGGTLFCPINQFLQLFPNQKIGEIGLKLVPGVDPKATAKALCDRLQVDVYPWEELYPALTAALLLEKYAILAIISLITLAAGINSIALLLMFIQRKRHTIATLLAMGVSPGQISRSFIIANTTLSTVGCSLGVALACATTWFINTYKPITLPQAYYAEYLPAHMTLKTILLVLCLNALVGLVAAWYATRTIYKIPIYQTLRQEQ
jgi:lipoprotein-releasing system permease protein